MQAKARHYMCAIVRNGASYTILLKNSIRFLRRSVPSRTGYCQITSGRNSRITSSVADWNMVSCVCAAIPVMLSIWRRSVKRRGFCPSCGARRMAESAALLVDEVLPREPMRQWVLSFPFQLRFLFASRPRIMGRVLGIVYRVIATHLIAKEGMYAGFAGAKTGDQKGWSDPQDGPPWCSHADSMGTSLYPTLGQPAAMVIGNPANRSTVWIGAEKIAGSDF